MKAIGVIPARWASTRLPGKVLADINGQPMIQHVWKRAKQSRLLEEVFIACDDEKVFKAAQGFGAKAILTSKNHASGTDRIIEAVGDIKAEIILNIQGDEPLVHPEMIDATTQVLLENPACQMSTVIRRITDEKDISDPNVVKVVIDTHGYALYFSRSSIPFTREKKGFSATCYYKHFGIYGYRKDFLLGFQKLPSSELEQTEKLEQLRVLEAGFKIMTVITAHDTISVDTPQDLARVVDLLNIRP
jgi:3-deoxy-manno-octulosonate cytidylyltransferase (CMP-KDO synthetase)